MKPSNPGHAGAPPVPVLDIRQLSVQLPPGADRLLAVRAASLLLDRGRTLCLVGESGSGKSMIASAVMGLLPANVKAVEGSILLQGDQLLGQSEMAMRQLRGSKVSMIFQEPMTALNPLMRIADQLGELLDSHAPVPSAERHRLVVEALRAVELPAPEQIAWSYPFALSGGQRQRVMIAAAMLLRPALLIADEPTTALDVTTQAQILKLMRKLQQDCGTAILFITHDFGVVAQIADEVAVIFQGDVVEFGPASQVLGSPQHPYTRKLIAAIPASGPGRAAQDAAGDTEPILAVRDLCKTYAAQGAWGRKRNPVHALDKVCLELVRGKTLGIVGESGSGKSTLGRCIAGLASFDAGEILFEGAACTAAHRRPPHQRGKVQMVFQDPYSSLNPRQRVGDAIASGIIIGGGTPKAAEAEVLRLLKLVGLQADAAARYPHEFSGGQRQRIAIARALSTEPRLLIADEPVSALDVSVQAQVLALFDDIRSRLGISLVFITHDLRIAAHLCDEIVVMQRGCIVEHGPASEVLGRPRHSYTQQLLDAVPKLPAFGHAHATGLEATA